MHDHKGWTKIQVWLKCTGHYCACQSCILFYSSFHVNSEYYFAAPPSLSFVPNVRNSGQTYVQEIGRTLIYWHDDINIITDFQKPNGCYTVSDLKRPVVTDLPLRGMILPTGRLGRGTLQAGATSVTSTSSLDDDPRLVGGKYCAVGNLILF